jgi:hypothetical protein
LSTVDKKIDNITQLTTLRKLSTVGKKWVIILDS